MRLRKRSSEDGRAVNGVVAQVVPRGSIRALMARHRRDLRVVSDAAEVELARRNAPEPSALPAAPDAWSVERGRRQLVDLIARATRSDERRS